MSWTDERVDILRKLWGEGRTAAEIAKELGGVTRNAVIGKAHRLKLSNRISPIQQNKKPLKMVKTPEKKVKKRATEQNNRHIDHDRKTVSLMDLGSSMCRWPIGDPQEKSFGFCGDSNISGLPYCAEHAKVAYQAATRNRILQAEKAREATAQAKAHLASKKAASK